jgi:DNA-binding Xre family transcriptional regulator
MIRAYEQRSGVRLTYAELAKRAGLARATVESVASRSAYNATLATIDKLCGALECTLTDLVHFRPGPSGEEASPVAPRRKKT